MRKWRPRRPSTPASSSARVRARLARFGGARATTVNPVLEPLLQTVRATHPRADLAIIERAYEVAETAHRGQLRKSGDAYITHPLAVTTILAELGMTPATLAAALLHDTVEDTAYGLGQLEKDFGREVAMLVDGVTKLDKVTLRRRRAGRDRAQDGRGDGQGHPRAGHQARRPPPQRAHLALRLGRVGPAQGPRDPRDLRAARPPARHEHHQVGARGPLVRDALPQGLRRDRAARRRARPGPRGVPRRGPRAGRRRPQRQDQGRGHRPARSTTTPCTRR